MKKKLVIFGTGDLAQVAHCYFSADSIYEVVAFTANIEYVNGDKFENKPLVAFEQIASEYPPLKFDMFIAVGYNKMNSSREKIYVLAKGMGYTLATYISPRCSYLSGELPGENTFIFEDNTIQPFVKIGNNVILWSGNHIGHHTVIDDHNFISSHVVISGHCHIRPNCFLGVNATVGNNVVIENYCIIGAGAVITARTEPYGVYVPSKTVKLNKKSTKINF
jgi:sugar O-acyltransferase (sialic acid O-acetyltransferase NeuD family)